MDTSLLINGKWTAEPKVTGVQRYATELRAAFDRLGIGYDLAAPPAGGRVRRLVWEQRALARLAMRYRTLFCPANMAPVRIPGSTRLVVTLHCLRFMRYPQYYSSAFARWYRFVVPRILERADTVLTVSRAAAEEIGGAYPYAASKLRVVYPGVSAQFTPEGSVGEIEGRYWLFMGDDRPAKNLRTLITALGQTKGEHKIALAGVDRERLAALETGAASERLLPLGHVNDPVRLAALARGAIGLVAPSVYESFGLPALEAMASGTPVLASSIPAHEEVTGGAAELLDPSDIGAWARAMDRLAADETRREELASLGLARAASFCWDRSAREVAQAIEIAPEAAAV